ncbi:hypothetical protein BsWGS_08905 [Bradybaena similaris]
MITNMKAVCCVLLLAFLCLQGFRKGGARLIQHTEEDRPRYLEYGSYIRSPAHRNRVRHRTRSQSFCGCCNLNIRQRSETARRCCESCTEHNARTTTRFPGSF